MIKLMSAAQMLPRFGYAIPEENTVFINYELPRRVFWFVLAHELYHLKDKTKWWVLREIKANIVAGIKYPLGFMQCAYMSFALYRLKFYWQRITGRMT